MFENGCYLRRQKRFKIPKTERDPSGAKSRSKEGGRNRHGGHGGHSNGSGSDLLSSSGDHDIKKVKSSDLFSVAVPVYDHLHPPPDYLDSVASLQYLDLERGQGAASKQSSRSSIFSSKVGH